MEEVLNRWRLEENKVELLYNLFLVRYIFNNNRLEGINLSYSQTKEIFEKERVSDYAGDVRDIFSVLNSQNTFDFLIRSWKDKRPIDIDFILELHGIAMQNSFDKVRYEIKGERPGEFKKHDYVVGRNDIGVEPSLVKDSLLELLEFVNSKEGKDALKVATVLHCEFESIHPFADGNGRVGRWLLNYYLLIHDYPMLIVFEDDKEKYYEILEKYNLDENPQGMYNFFKSQIERTWRPSGGRGAFGRTNEFI